MAASTDPCWDQHRKGKKTLCLKGKTHCFVNSNTKSAHVLHQLLARGNNCEAFFHQDKGLPGDRVRKGGTRDAPRHSQAEQNCWISPSYFKIKPLVLWLQVNFPAGQLLWISWPQLRSYTERLLGATEVSPGPASTSSCQRRSRTTANCSQRKCIYKQGLPGAIPSWPSSAACALSPPVTSQKVLLYKMYDWFF